MDKYIEDAEKACELDDNYFDAMTRSTNTSPVPQEVTSEPTMADQVQIDIPKDNHQLNQQIQNLLESLTEDTSATPEQTKDHHDLNNPNLQQDHQEELSPTEQNDK